jgi:peptidoglycan-N-acetylglucosamine deacetylase
MARLMFSLSLAGKLLALALWLHGPRSPWLIAAFFFVPDFFALYHLFAPSAQGFCRVFTRFKTDRPEIWLTIDDGPDDSDTPQILDLLDHHQARATFFLIGERAARFPDLVEEILRRGHEIGHHTQTHPVVSFWCASPSRVRAELDQGLASLLPAQPRWFRSPVGIKNPFLAASLSARNLGCVGWTVRSHDSTGRDPSRIVSRVMHQVRPGAIVLMHEGPSLHAAVRVRALELLLSALATKGFACVVPEPIQLR